MVFVPVYWLWVGTTMHANLHDADETRDRLGTFATAACGLVLAIALPHAYGEHALAFSLAYWVGRLVLVALVTHRPHRHAFLTFTVLRPSQVPSWSWGQCCQTTDCGWQSGRLRR